jgi:hypothetical protein
MKKTIIAVTLIAIVVIGAGWFYSRSKSSTTNTQRSAQTGEIVSSTGIHWHPQLSIYIKGQKQVIPANIGIGKQYANSKWYDPMMSMTDFHTHDTSGELHWEVMEGPVTRDHVTLKAFFEVWGKTFNANQIFDAKNGPDETVKMTVNGQPNTEFNNYQVKDKDKIEVRYE